MFAEAFLRRRHFPWFFVCIRKYFIHFRASLDVFACRRKYWIIITMIENKFALYVSLRREAEDLGSI